MKKYRLVALMLLLALLLAGCAAPKQEVDPKEAALLAEREREEQENKEKEAEEKEAIKQAAEEIQINVIEVGVLRNQTAMSVAFLGTEEESYNLYRLNVYDSAELLKTALLKNEIQMAFMPALHAVNLHVNNDAIVRIVSINTLGNLCVLSNQNEAKALVDIKSTKIFAHGAGVLSETGIVNALNIEGLLSIGANEGEESTSNSFEFYQGEDDFITAFASTYGSIGVVTEVTASKLLANYPGITRLADFSNGLISGVCVMRSDFIEQYPQALEQYFVDGELDVNLANEDVATAWEGIAAANIFEPEVTQDALQHSGLVFITGEGMLELLSNYFSELAKVPNIPEFLYYVK